MTMTPPEYDYPTSYCDDNGCQEIGPSDEPGIDICSECGQVYIPSESMDPEEVEAQARLVDDDPDLGE